ncbi:unnamed protein product [Orchesella dallaii]|uniref:RAP domain-containing protein n=1 Tax=Orchesella dallaii TaxID=48710 RepID=A0ABP1Q157_9HEXA
MVSQGNMSFMKMALSCGPKLVHLSSIAKCTCRNCASVGCTHSSRRSFPNVQSSLVSISYASNFRTPPIIPCGITSAKASSSANRSGLRLSSHGVRRHMSSWLRSSGVLFIKGTNGGDGTGYPSGNSRRSRTGKKLGETSILRQDGHNFEEVPAAVIRSNSSDKPTKGPPRSYVDLEPTEEAAYIEGFSNYHTPQEVLKMLDTIPSQEVTPFVSFSILKKLFELESNFGFRNEGRSWLNATDSSSTETFARLAIVTQLIDTITTTENNSLLLDTVDLLRMGSQSDNVTSSQPVYETENQLEYKNKLLQEVLIRVTEGKLELQEVCKAVIILGKLENDNGFFFNGDFIDKFWVGILDRSDDINSENVVNVLRTVKYFKKSSRLVLNLVERKLMSLWWKMSTESVAEICSILISDDGPVKQAASIASEKTTHGMTSWQVTNRLLMTLSKCTNLNIHKVSEKDLSQIVKTFYLLNFCDSAIEQALSKYMKAKCLKITDPQLVSNIMDFVRKFRLRFPSILEAASQFVVKSNASFLSPPQFASILRPFGELDFQPTDGPKLWEIVENYLSEKFIQFPPKDVISLLLSFVYLMKYPVNFVDKTFSPYFLDRLHTSEPNFTHLQQHRSNLKLLDTAMTVECKNKYGGPLLPKDFTSRTIFIDGRILRMSNVLKEAFLSICTKSSIDCNVILPSLPLNPVFSADIILTTPRLESETDRHNFLRNHINSYLLYASPPPSLKHTDLTVILVNIPEHFSSDAKYLIGIQSLRKRLLKSLGFNVVSMRYQELNVAKGDFNMLTEYIERKLADVPNIL